MATSTLTQDVTDQIDGVTMDFTVTGGPYVAGSLVVEYNGVRLRPGVAFDFVEAAGLDGFTLCFIAETDDTLQAQFEIEDNSFDFPLVVASGIDPGI